MGRRIRWTWKEAKPQDESPEVLRARVDQLAEILDGIPWILGGGLSIPFTLGEFHRAHSDIDLLFEDAHFPAIETRFEMHGYELWQHSSMSLFGLMPGRLHYRVRSDGVLPQLRRRALKFRPVHGRSTMALQSVDALPFEIVDGRLCTCDKRHYYPVTRPIVGHHAKSSAGHDIPCLAFEYVALLKGPRREPKDLQDFAIIRDLGQLPAGDWGV